MDFVEKNLKIITQILLLSVILIVPFLKTDSLYFPFVSGKAYAFRALVALAFFFWVWLLLCQKQYRLNWKNILVVALGLFFLAQLIASFFGVDPLYSLFSSIERAEGVLHYGFWLVYFLMFLSVFQKERDWKAFFLVFTGVAGALSVYSWFDDTWNQLQGIFGNPAYFAAFLLFAIGFCLVAFERQFFERRFQNSLFLVAAGFFVVTLVFTQVRGVYVGLAGGVFLFCLLSILFLRKEHKKLAFGCGAIMIAGIVSLGVLFAAKDTDVVQNTRLLWRVTEVTQLLDSSSVRERVLNWSIALKAFQERPLFGYGPENFGSAANKYYDFRIGEGEPWFDRAHNQVLDTLATGGFVVFSMYLFWLGAAAFLIAKIARRQRMLGFLLASVFLAYFLQGLFLFDLLAVYLGLFPFLAFVIYKSRELSVYANGEAPQQQKLYTTAIPKHLPIIGVVALVCVFVVYTSVFMPYRANAAALQFFAYSQNGLYKESIPFVKEAFDIRSPYTMWEVRKRIGWQFVQVLEYEITKDTPPEKIQEIQEIYDIVIPEVQKFVETKPYDPQMYYVLGKTYRLGFEKLGRDDLEKSEAVLRKGFMYSDLRIEYYNEISKTLLLEGKVEEAEQTLVEYIARTPKSWGEEFPFLTAGHFYFVAGEYAKALEQYEAARAVGHSFVDVVPEYSRYMFVAEKTGNYEKIIEVAQEFLDRWGPDADTYFNLAVGYLNLEEKEIAKEFFLKAVELKSAYSEYESFFLE